MINFIIMSILYQDQFYIMQGLQQLIRQPICKKLLYNFINSKPMEKLRARSQVRLYDKQLLPSLKANSASFMGRTIVPISKFDLDSNMILKDQRRLQMMSKGQISENITKQRPKIKRNIIQSFIPTQYVYKMGTSDSKRQQSNDNFEDILQRNPSKNLVNVEQSKTSSKSYGYIKGYAANSHPGLFSLVNQDRICIVTNLNKTNVKVKQISFFSIYDGSNGLLKTDYFRDNFHLILNSQQDLTSEPQKAIKNTIQKIEKNLSSQIIHVQDVSKVGYAILISIGQTGYIVVCGNCKVALSKNFGEEIQKINLGNQAQTISKIQHTRKMFMKKDQSINICIKRVDLDSDLDFIVLGSEGLFQSLKEEQICRKLWANIIKNKNQNLHLCLGQTTLNILNIIFGLPSTKNASIIMLGFKNIQSCFKGSQKLDLPYMQQQKQAI